VDTTALLAASEVDPTGPRKRFTTDGHRAYCGHEHSPGCWHGFPVEWRHVPATILGGDADGWVDIHFVVNNLGIEVSGIDLSDDEVRAVSVFGPTQRPHVFYNRRTRWGQSDAVQRFTLAHELCHLLLDREHGDELAIATGPWAPVGIEQRANAFAAAFLMPT
jgi:hypothetical protein